MEGGRDNTYPVIWLIGFVFMSTFLLIEVFIQNPVNYLMVMGGFMIMMFGACVPFAHNFIEEDRLYE